MYVDDTTCMALKTKWARVNHCIIVYFVPKNQISGGSIVTIMYVY